MEKLSNWNLRIRAHLRFEGHVNKCEMDGKTNRRRGKEKSAQT